MACVLFLDRKACRLPKEEPDMSTIKKWIICLGLIATVLPAFSEGLEWLTDVPMALDKARRENKIVMLDFTGSDWCGWCMRLKREVFDQPEFAAFAQENIVPVEVDFPHAKPQSVEQQAANQELAQKYQIRGYPTLIYLNSAGQKIAEGGYIEGGAKNFITATERIPGVRHVEGTTVARAVQPAQADEPPRRPPSFVPIAPTNPTRYGELALKGISGAANRRMALINNETLMVGETAKVKVQDKRVEVYCKEIREDSVLVTVDGTLTELKLGQHSK